MRRATVNDRAIKAFRNKRKLTDQFRKLKQQQALLDKRIERLEDDLRLARDTTKIVNRVALDVDGANVKAIDEELSLRWTRSYTNVHDGGTGLRFCEWREQGGYDEMAIITSQPEKLARKRALAWVLRGELPKGEKDLIVHYSYRSKERAH